MELKLNRVRLAFPALFVPESIAGSPNKSYSAVFLMEPGSENAKATQAAVLAVAREKWQDKADGVLRVLAEEKRICYHTRDRLDKNGQVYEGFGGMHYINSSLPATDKAGNPNAVVVVGRSRETLTAASGKPYPGAIVNCILDVWPQDNQYGRRVNAQLRAVQFVEDAPAFAGVTRVVTGDAFDVLDAIPGDAAALFGD